MSNQAMNSYEGITITLIGQVVDITYHGVSVPSQKGNGILGKMVEPIINSERIKQGKTEPTTVAVLLDQQPIKEYQNAKLAYIGEARAQALASNKDLHEKVANFHSKLNSLKEGLLKGKNSNTVTNTELKEVVSAMKPYNVGKVLKVKIQARVFSKEIIPSYHRVKTGGSSTVNTLYTLYFDVQTNDEVGLEDIMSNLKDLFLDTRKNPSRTRTVTTGATVLKDSGNRIVITPNRPVVEVNIAEEEGQEPIMVPVEGITKSSLFVAKVRTKI